jgi:hypothetical protein
MRWIEGMAMASFFCGCAQAADLSEMPSTTVALCRGAIEEWAAQFQPISVDTAVIRPEMATSEGKRIELAVQVVYDTQGGPETRNANIGCTVDRNGSVSVAELSR